MSRARRSFSPELLARLQGMPVKTALDLLGQVPGGGVAVGDPSTGDLG